MLALMMIIAHLAAQPGDQVAGGQEVLRTTTAPAPPEKIRKDDLVCRKEALVGTRMKTKVCLTKAEWVERGEADRDSLEKAQSQKPLQF